LLYKELNLTLFGITSLGIGHVTFFSDQAAIKNQHLSQSLPLPNIINDKYNYIINFTLLQLFLRRPKRTLKKILDIAFEA
jgi:hypothetical protein